MILDDFGLQQAVAWYTDEFARQHGIDTRFEPEGDLAGLPANVATHLSRIVQESLTTVARHAEASQVDVRLTRDADAKDKLILPDGALVRSGGTQVRSMGYSGSKAAARRNGAPVPLPLQGGIS